MVGNIHACSSCQKLFWATILSNICLNRREKRTSEGERKGACGEDEEAVLDHSPLHELYRKERETGSKVQEDERDGAEEEECARWNNTCDGSPFSATSSPTAIVSHTPFSLIWSASAAAFSSPTMRKNQCAARSEHNTPVHGMRSNAVQHSRWL